jgi:hypothetical protein
MKIDKNAWLNLMDVVEIQCNSIRNKSANLGHNVEVSAKNGGTETLLNMIVELESTLRVLKRRLQETLPSHNGCCSNSETHKEGNRTHCDSCGGVIENPLTKSEIGKAIALEQYVTVIEKPIIEAQDYLMAAISKELDKHYPIK